jgi:hypothetical protein
MPISFTHRLKLPDDVLISGLQSESVLLNLNSERYFGLDDVGTHILSVLTTSDSIDAAYTALQEEYEVEGEILRRDLISLIEELLKQGLIEIVPEEGKFERSI